MNEQVFILIKDYGVEGQKIHGVTKDKRVVDLWMLVDYGWVVMAEIEGTVTNDPLPAVRI